MRNYVQILLDPDRSTDYDRHTLAQIRIYWAGWIQQMPSNVKKARQGYLWLQHQTQVDAARIRRLFQDLKIDPHT